VLSRRRRAKRSQRPAKVPTVALAGAGYIAVVHALAVKSAGMRVAAVASAGGSSARHLAGELDARRCRPGELPAGCDMLIVASPPGSHLELALQGLRAGATVLVEKPLVSTLREADELVAAARSADADGRARLRCAENLLHSPLWRAANELRPTLGQLDHLSLRAEQPPPDWGHFTGPLTAGGVLFDLGPHPVALALGLAREAPVAVRAELLSRRDDGADDDARVEVRFASGLVASLHVSWRGELASWDAQASSDQGVLRLEILPEPQLSHNGRDVALAARHAVPDPRLEELGYVDQLLDTWAGGAGQSVEDARAVLEVIAAAYSSAGADGAEITLPFTGDRTATPMQLWREG
jgi:predicted dehydrogenase